MRVITFLSCLYAAGFAYGQSVPAKVEFEVASVRPSAPGVGGQAGGVMARVDGARVRYVALTLKAYLSMAYGVRQYQIVAPDWVSTERYDITAKLPQGATAAQVPDMLQSLLSERFQMKLRQEKKEVGVYALTISGKSLKLVPSPLDPEAEAAQGGKGILDVSAGVSAGAGSVSFGRGSYLTVQSQKLVGKKLSMQVLAAVLSRFLDRPVIDATDLTETYDLEVPFSPRDFPGLMARFAMGGGSAAAAVSDNADPAAESLFAALDHLGLKLEKRKSPVDFVIVEEARKTPTEN